LPASLGLALLSEEIVRIIYERGSFSESDAVVTAGVLVVYSAGLLPLSLQKVLSATFFARGDTGTPVKVSFLSVLSEGLFGAFFAFVVGLGIYGLPVGTVLSSLTGFVLLLRKSGIRADVPEVAGTFIRSAASAAVMGALVWILKSGLTDPLQTVALAVPLGAVLYFLSLLLLRESLTLRLFKSFVQKLGNP